MLTCCNVISTYSFVLTRRSFFTRFKGTETFTENFFKTGTANTSLTGSVDNGVLVDTFGTQFRVNVVFVVELLAATAFVYSGVKRGVTIKLKCILTFFELGDDLKQNF